MNIDLGWLGKVVLEEMDQPFPEYEEFIITHDGYTESGIRVHGVLRKEEYLAYPSVWNDAIIICLGEV